jgi:hypothetical protein
MQKYQHIYKLQAKQTTFKPPKLHHNARRNIYNTLALSAVLYSSETWVQKAKDKFRMTASEM